MSDDLDPVEPPLPVVKDLPTRVAELAHSIRTSERVANTAKRAAEKSEIAAKKAAGAASRTRKVMALQFVMILVMGYFVYQIRVTQQVGCENANQGREAQRELWTNIVDAQQNDPTRTPEQQYNSRVFREYVQKNFAERDCGDLDQKFEKPDFPEFKVPKAPKEQ